MLLLGVSTSPQIVHEMLPGPVLTRISTERFELPSAGTSLDQVGTRNKGQAAGLRKGALSVDTSWPLNTGRPAALLGAGVWVPPRQQVVPLPRRHVSVAARLHPAAAAYASGTTGSPLSDRAQVHLMPAIVAHVAQYALMDHYFANPLSVLTEPFGRRQSAAARAAILEQLTPLHAQALRLLPSLQRYACWLRNRRRGRAPLTAPFLCSPQLLRGARRVGPGGRQAPPVRRRLPAAAGGSPVPGPPGRPRAPRHRRPVRSAPPRPSPTVPALH